MRAAWASIVLAALLAGCDAAPDAVRPALKALSGLGYSCDGGVKDNVPSGLYQWHCGRPNRLPASSVLVDGNDRGIAEFDIVVMDTDPALARQAFAEVIAAVPPLSTTPGLAAGLDGWTGPQASRDLGGVGVTGLCDATQCIVFIGMVPGPTQPPS